MNYDNPAYRLLDILTEGKKIDANHSCCHAWAKILKTHPESPELYQRLAKVMELPTTIVSEILFSYPDEEDTWSHWVAQVNNGFKQQNLSQNWGTFINAIDKHSINYLKVHSRLLDVKSGLKSIDEDVLSQAKK